MGVYRISKINFANQLSSSGSANRWNYEGQNVIYTGSSRSLSTLELIIHKGHVKPTIRYQVMVISIADYDHLISQVTIAQLPANWRKLAAYSTLQKIGSDWYENQETLILKVPSVIIPSEHNFVINTEHPDFHDHVKLIRTEDYFWDTRLI